VGIVGLGSMGGAMAAHLLEQGWPVQVCDLDAAKVRALQTLGAQGRSDSARASEGCKALIVCVVDAIQTEEVLFGPHGAAAAMGPGQGVLLCTTIAQGTWRIFPGDSPTAGLVPLTRPCPAAPPVPGTAR
jgi:putative dehydrogenase